MIITILEWLDAVLTVGAIIILAAAVALWIIKTVDAL